MCVRFYVLCMCVVVCAVCVIVKHPFTTFLHFLLRFCQTPLVPHFYYISTTFLLRFYYISYYYISATPLVPRFYYISTTLLSNTINTTLFNHISSAPPSFRPDPTRTTILPHFYYPPLVANFYNISTTFLHPRNHKQIKKNYFK